MPAIKAAHIEERCSTTEARADAQCVQRITLPPAIKVCPWDCSAVYKADREAGVPHARFSCPPCTFVMLFQFQTGQGSAIEVLA
eukprot:1132744-Pelagomonas_calceolata.AAC.10